MFVSMSLDQFLSAFLGLETCFIIDLNDKYVISSSAVACCASTPVLHSGSSSTWTPLSNFAYSICVFTLSTYFTIARRALRWRSIPSLFAFSTIPLVLPRVNVRSLRCFDRKFLVDPNFAPSKDRIWLPIYNLLCSLTNQNACFITFSAFNKQILELNYLFSALCHQKTAIRLQ